MIRIKQKPSAAAVRTLEYASPLQQRQRRSVLRHGRAGRGKRIAVRLVVWGVALALVAAYAAYRLNRADPDQHAAHRDQCAANLRYLGVAVEQYAAAHDGKLPATMADLLLDLQSAGAAAAMVCPASGDAPAPGGTPREQTDAVRAGGPHLSYVYLGKGMTHPVGHDVVLMYEPAGHHGGEGANVLFGDGRVVFVPPDAAQQIVSQVAAGAAPVVWPPRAAKAEAATTPTAPRLAASTLAVQKASGQQFAPDETLTNTVTPATETQRDVPKAPPAPPKRSESVASADPAEQVRRMKCHSNLLRLGEAISRHARRNGGRTPARLEDLVLAGRATPSDFVCPSSHDTPAPGGAPPAWATRLSNGGHRSYVYPKQSAGVVPDDDAVILYESSAEHHGHEGAHVLLGDGRVEFVTAEQLEQIRRQAADGPGPVSYTAGAR